MRIRQDIYRLREDLNYLGENVSEAVAKPFENAGLVGQNFGKRQWDNTIGIEDRYHRIPKKPKLLKFGKWKRKVHNFPMYKRKYYRRKGKLTRSRGSRSLVKLIKTLATEPRKHIAAGNALVASIQPDDGIMTQLNNIVPNTTVPGGQWQNTATGQKYYLKGMKFKAFIRNRSNVPMICTILFSTMRVQSGPRLATTNGQNIFYSPVFGNTATPVSRALIAANSILSAVSPKLHPEGPLRELKRFVFTLASTTTQEGAVDAAELDVEPSPNHADMKNISYWMNINKVVRQDVNSGNATGTGHPIYMHFFCSPAFLDLQPVGPGVGTWDATRLPLMVYESVLAWRDT